MFKKLENFMDFIFKMAKWILMILFVVFVIVLFRSCSSTVEEMDAIKNNVIENNTKPTITKSDIKNKNSTKSFECKIEDWKYKQFTEDSIQIDGTTTCSNGRIVIKLYDGNTGNYISNKETYIRSGAFKTYVDGIAPKNLEIKYSISSR